MSASPEPDLYVPPPNEGALRQIAELRAGGRSADAALIERLVGTPQAVWFTKGSPRQVRAAVGATIERASGTLPVLVAYDIPFRDCAQFSAGGATTTRDYLDWIDGIADGIGDAPAIVILEPDGLGIIPWYASTGDGQVEWCRPTEADPMTAAADRFAQLNAAVDRLVEQPNARVYLDATHSAWLSVDDAADRLVRAGVERAGGFFLNVSNYQSTEDSIDYGSRISARIALAGAGASVAITHFVIDTSRNGRGPWTPPAGAYTDPQEWCNPPGRGIGLRPTLRTGVPLLDAYLWIKIPGESDGECTRGLGSVGTVDPEWGAVDPAAGRWFPELALELARNEVRRPA